MPRMGDTPDTIRRRPPRRNRARGGFTLVELLVAMTIFITVMSSVMFLFSAAIRISKQGFQSQDAFEIARGAMDILERDLSRSFTSRDHGDVFNFYGTPIGFTFIGMITADESSTPNLARVTYVIHRSAEAQILEAVPFDDEADTRRDTFALLRLIETGAEDLESFQVDWDNISGDPQWNLVDPPSGMTTLRDLIGDPADPGSFPGSAVSLADSGSTCDLGDITCLQEIEKAMKRELWIRMLSGEEGLPNIWSLLDLDHDGLPDGQDPEDFVVAENILNVHYFTGLPLVDSVPLIDPDHVAVFDENQFAGFLQLIDGVVPQSIFFTYREFGTGVIDAGTAYERMGIAPIELAFWNDRRNIEYMQFREGQILNDERDNDGDLIIDEPDEANGINLGSPLDARVPTEITAKFTLFFESPYVGAPDFNRRFTMRIDLPTGYRRTFQTPVAPSP